uniref:Uncharacterized protein n=1 Tax=Setaria italica TaxID=4555 RepID=K3ZYX8_SETIT
MDGAGGSSAKSCKRAGIGPVVPVDREIIALEIGLGEMAPVSATLLAGVCKCLFVLRC